MLTVLVKLYKDYLDFMFDYYGALYERCHVIAKQRLEEQNLNGYKYWNDKQLMCLSKRQKVLNKMLSVRGYNA